MAQVQTFKCPQCEAVLGGGDPEVAVRTELVQEPNWTPWNPSARGGQAVITIVSCPACEKAIGAVAGS